MWTCFPLSRISVKWQFSVPSVLKELQLPLKKIHATETMQTHQKTRNNTLITFRDCQDHFRQNDLCTYKTLKGNVEFAHWKSSHIFLTMTCAKLLLRTFFREKKKTSIQWFLSSLCHVTDVKQKTIPTEIQAWYKRNTVAPDTEDKPPWDSSQWWLYPNQSKDIPSKACSVMSCEVRRLNQFVLRVCPIREY